MATAGVAGGVSAALTDSSGELKKIHKKVNNFICQILPKIDKSSISKRKMKLSESYCIIWHHRSLGVVDGRKTNDKLISCAFGAVVLDLWVANKIDIEVKGKLTDDCVEALVKVVDATKTNSFLDAAGFNEMLSAHKRNKVKSLLDYIENCNVYTADMNCVSVVLDNFVEKGIVGKENKLFGLTRKYPTKDKEPQIQLMLEVRRILLKGAKPDGYMSALISLLRFADNLHSSEDPLLKRYFDDAEYSKAKPRLEEVLRNAKSSK